jgi:hypothetical protein
MKRQDVAFIEISAIGDYRLGERFKPMQTLVELHNRLARLRHFLTFWN